MIATLKLYKDMILAAIISLLLLAVFVQSYRINSYKADLANSNAQISILGNSIDLQNESMNRISKDSLERTQKAMEELNKVKASNGINDVKIKALKSNIGKITTCDLAVINAKDSL